MMDPDEFVEECRRETARFSTMQLGQNEKELFSRLKGPISILGGSQESCRIIRALLERAGTNVQQNDEDSYGDGDQRKVGGEPKAQILRELFAMGGDIEHHMIDRLCSSLSDFAWACIAGDTTAVERAIRKTARASEERRKLLERRYSSMRLSPLLLAVAMSKHPGQVLRHKGIPANKQDHLGVVHVLLRYGARPDAQDVCGKTVMHYGAGIMATEQTLLMSDACIVAYQSGSFGDDVLLKGLKNVKYNGAKGTLGGFDALTSRRVVHLKDEDRELSLKPENIFDSNGKCVVDKNRKLTDIPDRVGTISLHEVVMSQRDDVARFLVEKHDTSLDVAELNGISPRGMVLKSSVIPGAKVNDIIKARAVKQGRKVQRAEKKSGQACFSCQANLPPEKLSTCTKCRYAQYCSRDCQLADWKNHKPKCKEMRKGVKVEDVFQLSPGLVTVLSSTNTTYNGMKGYTRPKGVAVDEWFWIKVQSNGIQSALLIYDESRSCCFQISPGREAHAKLVEVASQQEAVMGRKVHVQARFDSNGDCFVYPHTACLKKW